MEELSEINFKALPKGELHIHLFGAITTSVALDLIKMGNEDSSSYTPTVEDLRVPAGCCNLAQYLTPWKFLRLIPQGKEALQIIVDDVFRQLHTENVKFVELRNTIVNIAKLNFVSTKVAMLWIIECITCSSTKYGIIAGLILTIQRGPSAYSDFTQLAESYKALKCPKIIVGFDIAGDESIPTDNRIAHELTILKEKYDLGITIHAGETGNIKNVIEAVNIFKADRIGHGTAALQNDDILTLLHEKNICLEICPISNELTGAINSSNIHEFEKLIEYKIPFVICSDNPGIQNSTLSSDYAKLSSMLGVELINEKMFKVQSEHTFIKEV